MRALSLVELENRIDTDFSDIVNSGVVFSQEKITQFFNFLHEQPISKRILERITADFYTLKKELPVFDHTLYIDAKVLDNIQSFLRTKEDQGAFGFFTIQELFEIETKLGDHYFQSIIIWYPGLSFRARFDCFKEKFFKPFIELLKWYIYESQVKSEKDYYSKSEITVINDKLDKILATQTASTQVIFEEIEELKGLILFLNKKNWVEVFKGKLGDAAFAEILTNDNAKSLFNYISENISFLT